MTQENPSRDVLGRTAFQPPEAVLYFQFSRRRRIVSAALVTVGFTLASLLIAYGGVTQKRWSLMAAVASAIAGFVAMWLYRRRVRPTQIAENRERANALFRSFDGRLELHRRLALTQEGVEIGGETVSWPSIHGIDASVADAMSKHVTLSLGAAHGTRRLSISLAGLAEQPGVAYAVMKMLWMRQVTAKNVAAIQRGPRSARIAFPRTSSTKATMWSVAGMLAIVAGFIATMHFVEDDRVALGALSAGIAIAVFLWTISRSTKADWLAAAQVEERIDELATAALSRAEFVIRRKAPRTWPIVITILFFAPAAIFFAMGDSEIAAVFLLFAAVISSVTWLIAWWMGSGTIATLTASGIALRTGEIAWDDIASIDVFIVPKVETGMLTLRLTRPRPPQTLGQRINSTLSRGTSDREIVVSLARSEEPPAVVLSLVRDRWRDALGPGRAAAAESAQLARMVRASRTWNQFSVEEKARSLKIGGVILAILVACVYGVSADFRMSERWFAASLAGSGFLTAVGAFKLIRANVFVSLRNQQGTPSYIAVFLMLCVAGWMVFWVVLGRSLPDLFARQWGTPSIPEVRYDKRRLRSEDDCHYPLSIYLPGDPYRFCVTPAAFASLPDEGKLRVELRETWFGVHIDGFETLGN
jgi:hypothetical protein